jgi:tetratricopeptide (TPR) repeat protein
MGKLEVFKEDKAKHSWRKDKWIRWKKSQALLGRSRNINYKAWEYWEPDTDTEDEGDPILPRHNPEFLAMEADMKQRHKKEEERGKTAEKCRQRGNQCMKDGDFVGAIEHYEEGLEYKRSLKALWTNKGLAELKVFRWHDAIQSCNKVIEYSEIFEDGFKRSADACFKAFVRRALALRALHQWGEALKDLEEALQLFPKDREARDLLEKTNLARQEADYVGQQQKEAEGKQDPPPIVPGPVRVEIEESEDEEDAEALSVLNLHYANSLSGLGKQEFADLFARLKSNADERSAFCARGGCNSTCARAEDSHKLKISAVEEVSELSRLDATLRDAERCCVLWRKGIGNVVPLRDDVKQMASGDEARQMQETREEVAFLHVTTPRVLSVLHILASFSDHHCALTMPAVRHIWPLLENVEWRQDVLELLMEWSQRSISAKAMVEFAGRYPDPHLHRLLEIIKTETKENMMPPGFEDRAQRACLRMEQEAPGAIETALADVMQGLAVQSPTELAISILGNMCLSGHLMPIFKEQLATLMEDFLRALCRFLKPQNWRLCGRTAGAICNLVRCGELFAKAVQEHCLVPLVAALRDECAQEGPASLLKSMCSREEAAAMSYQGSASRLLGALINLLVIRPSAMQQVLELGVLDITLPLIDPDAELDLHDTLTEDNEGSSGAVSSRAALLSSRLLGSEPSRLSREAEADLLSRLFRLLERHGEAPLAQAGDLEAELQNLDITVRLVTIILTRTPGALERITQTLPRCVELADNATAPPPDHVPAVSFVDLCALLTKLVVAAEPTKHVGPDEEGGLRSRIAGNLALLFGALCEAQDKESASPALRELNLSPLVRTFVSLLRKERGRAQQNIGVCVTRLAQSSRYRQQVRDLKGIESLHQIQLPHVQAQKAEAERLHRLNTSVDAQISEATKRRQLRSLRGLD